MSASEAVAAPTPSPVETVSRFVQPGQIVKVKLTPEQYQVGLRNSSFTEHGQGELGGSADPVMNAFRHPHKDTEIRFAESRT